MKFCILISVFCLLTSVGLALDVGVDTILAPSWTIDSGQSIIPRMVISNLSNEPADSVSAFFTIDDGTPHGYSDSMTGFHLDALATETLAFAGWVPRGRDSMTETAWIHCDGDTNPQNDTCRVRFFVRIKDIGLSDLWPAGDTFDSGQVIVPHVRVWNLGNVALSFRLWRDSMVLPPGEDTVIYADSISCKPGIWAIQAFVVVVGDLHPENNLIVDTFSVRGTTFRDVGVTRLWRDSGHIRAVVANFGNEAAGVQAFFVLRDSALQTLFEDSLQLIVGPNDSSEVEMAGVQLNPGLYMVACSAWTYGDQDSTNNVKYLWFRVPGGAVEECPKPRASSHKPAATVVRSLPAGAVAFDAMGRRAVEAKPGVYFVWDEGRGAGDVGRMRKVVIQR